MLLFRVAPSIVPERLVRVQKHPGVHELYVGVNSSGSFVSFVASRNVQI